MKKIFSVFLLSFSLSVAKAQIETYVSDGEFGLAVGASNYRGDLNPYGKFNYLSPAVHGFYQKYFNNFIGIKASLGYVHLRYNDKDHKNLLYKERNLNFGNHTAEFSLTGVFHFFRYAPGYEGNNFTPYISLGAGILYSNPYTTHNGKKYLLRRLGTEGQYSATPHDGKKYMPVVVVFPLSVGIKKSVSERLAVFAECGYRFTTTDYIDDVSSTYAGSEAFLPENYKGANAELAMQLHDRSPSQIGVKGFQRGNSLAKDGYLTLQIGISYNLSACNCPKVY